MAALKQGLIHRALHGETRCGDAFGVFDQGEFVVVVAADGLGHGPEAQAASEAAIAWIAKHLHKSVETLLEGCHRALGGSRGAVMGIARIDRVPCTLTYASVGNIEARVIGADHVLRPVAINGIVGYNARIFRSEVFPFLPGDMLLLHSDGISDRFNLSVSARGQDPQVLADQLAAAHGRPNDDQLLLIVTDDGCSP